MAEDGVIGDECVNEGVVCVCSIGAEIPLVVIMASDMVL